MTVGTYKQPTTVPSAMGYPNYSGNLTHPVVADRIIGRFYNTTFLSEITNTSYYDPIKGQGDTVRFFRPPRASVHKYHKDGYIKPQTLTAETFKLHINRALAYSLKIDCIDEYQMQMWPRFRQAYMEEVNRVMANTMEREVLCQAILEGHYANRGASAGCTCGTVDLGSTGKPRFLTSKNILIILAQIGQVLDEQEVPSANRYVVMPYCMRVVLMAALGSAGFTGVTSAFVGNGMDLTNLVGLKIHFTPNIHSVSDNGKDAFYMLFGHKDALAFATQMTKTKTATTADNFDNYLMGLQVYGFGVALPEALGLLYACVDPTPEMFCCG